MDEIKILVLEHDPSDVELMEFELKKALPFPIITLVKNEEEYTNALESVVFDLILAGYTFPSFNGLQAFDIKERLAAVTPFILVTGTIGEETAVELIKRGITDFVLKDHIGSLNYKIALALRDSQTQEHIKTGQERTRLIMNAALDAIIWIDIYGDITFWNLQAETIFGWKAKEVMGKKISGLIVPEAYRSRHEEGMKQYLKTGKGPGLNVLLELSAIKCSGEEFPIELTILPIRQGNQEFFCSFIRDITARKNAEKAIKEANERHHYVTKATSEAIWDWDLATGNFYRAEGFYDLFGYKPEELKGGLSFSDNIHPDDKQRVLKNINELTLGTGTIWADEYRYLKQDNHYAFVSDKGLVVRDEHGKATRLVGAMQDITKKKQEEQHLKLLESVITQSNDAVMITEAEPLAEPGPRIRYVNEAFTKMTGYSNAEVLGKTPRLLQGAKSERAELDKLGECLKNWQSCEITIINYKKNGEEFWNQMSISPVADANGWYTHWISIERDVTESKLIEQKLHQLNEDLKLQARDLALSNEELEQFAYVASHDLQEPLRMVTSFLDLLEKKYGALHDDKGKEYIAFAVDGAKRMRQIILDLLEFSRAGRGEDNEEDLDLNELVHDIQVLFRQQIAEKNAVISFDVLPVIRAYRAPMLQVLQNLLGNALTYTVENNPCRIHISSTESHTHFTIAVKDNGLGINKEYFEKIFIIFQRLHHRKQFAGTGVGLAITKKNVKNMGGDILVESEEGKGSTFYFTISKN